MVHIYETAKSVVRRSVFLTEANQGQTKESINILLNVEKRTTWSLSFISNRVLMARQRMALRYIHGQE